MTVYVDVLLGVNLLIDYLLLWAVAVWHRLKPRLGRTLWGASAMAAGSLVILLPDYGFLVGVLFQIGFALLGVLVAFGWYGWFTTIRLTATLFGLTFGFGGGMTVLSQWVIPYGVAVRNAAVYVAVSPLLLVAATLACYCVVVLISRLFRPKLSGLYLQLDLQTSQKTLRVTAKVDTGLTITDPYSGGPVVMISPTKAKEVGEWETSMRFIPCHTVQGYSMLSAFTCRRITVSLGQEQAVMESICLAVAKEPFNGPFHALVGNDFLERCEWNVATNMDKNASVLASSDRRPSRLHRRRNHPATAFDRYRGKGTDRASAERGPVGSGTAYHP